MIGQEQKLVHPAQSQQFAGPMRPIVISTKKKKKRKYSRGFRDIQVAGRKVTQVADDISRSISKGIRAYRKASDKSAQRKRDGAIRDFGLNLGKGIGASLRSASSVPYDLVRALNGRGARRGLRRWIRATARLNRRLGIR